MTKKKPVKTVRQKTKPSCKMTVKKTNKKPEKKSFKSKLILPFKKISKRVRGLRSRRVHRSFRMSRCRDYRRKFDIPGYFSFTGYVVKVLKSKKRLFITLALVYASLIAIFGGVTNQDMYNQIAKYISNSSQQFTEGGFGALSESLVVVLSAFMSGPGTLSPEQQIFLGLGLLMAWLATVWLLREILAGGKPKLRDGLYRANAPFLSTFLVLLMLLVQMIPLVIVAAIYAGVVALGLLTEGFGAMIFGLLIALVSALVLYWMTSTIIALVIVTLPGMYPMEAVRAAGDMVAGRRLKILFRIIWMIIVVGLAWLVFMVPMTMLVSWLSGLWLPLSYIPIMPLLASLMSSLSVVFMASYVYLMYRKLVDSEN